MQITTQSVAETKRIAGDIAQMVADAPRLPRREGAIILSLEGPLGAGKTAFVQGFARRLGVREKIASPTFVLMKRFAVPNAGTLRTLYHLDCYRLADGEDLLRINAREAFQDPHAVVLLEWGDRVRGVLPRNAVRITFTHAGRDARRITLHAALPVRTLRLWLTRKKKKRASRS